MMMMMMMIKPISPFGMELEDEALLLRSHLAAFKARMQVINPTKPAAFACSVQTYNKIFHVVKRVAPSEIRVSPKEPTSIVLSPATFKPETFAIKSQRRSPNSCTKFTSSMSSCSVHGPFRTSSCWTTIFV